MHSAWPGLWRPPLSDCDRAPSRTLHRDQGYKVGVQGQSEAHAASPNFNWNKDPGYRNGFELGRSPRPGWRTGPARVLWCRFSAARFWCQFHEPDEIMVAENVEARVADVETDQVDTPVAVQIEIEAFVCRICHSLGQKDNLIVPCMRGDLSD